MTQPFVKAQVKGGRLVLDEPTDLPEGSEVELAVVEDDGFDPDERAGLLLAIEMAAEEIMHRN